MAGLVVCALALCLMRLTSAQRETCNVAPVDYRFRVTQKLCECRARGNCSPSGSASATSADSAQLCPTGREANTPIYNITGTIVCGNNCNQQEVTLWQADKYGRFSSLSGCQVHIPLTGGRTTFTVQSPLPGMVTEGHHARYVSKHRGFLHVLVRTADGHVSELFKYPDSSYGKAAQVADSHLLTCTGQTCSFSIDLSCGRTGIAPHTIEFFVNQTKRRLQLPLGEGHGHTKPTIETCPKLRNLKTFYDRATVAVLVDPVSADSRTRNVGAFPKAARDSFNLQSTYLAVVKRVMKDNITRGTAFSRFNGTLTIKHGSLVQVQHYGDVHCCSEMRHGTQYLVMGIPLPIVGQSNPMNTSGLGDLGSVYRIFATHVFESGRVINHLFKLR